jgi:hypothetical protein
MESVRVGIGGEVERGRRRWSCGAPGARGLTREGRRALLIYVGADWQAGEMAGACT